MIVIIGCIIVLGSVLGGFSMAGGHMHSLVHPSEIVTIGGAAMGALIMMSSKKVLTDLVKGMIAAVKGSPFNKAMYTELFKLMYELTRLMRRSGLLALEPHLNDPHNSELFKKYPKISHNHHVLTFICDGFAPLIEGSVSEADKIRSMLEAEIAVMEEEHHLATGVLQKTADGLPGFGIVAAVLGIVITMGAIDGPVEEIGHKVGAALVGTFSLAFCCRTVSSARLPGGWNCSARVRSRSSGQWRTSSSRAPTTASPGWSSSRPAAESVRSSGRRATSSKPCSRKRKAQKPPRRNIFTPERERRQSLDAIARASGD
jgi:chemotaxis protein MotA